MKAAEILFWIFFSLIIYTYVGYGLILFLLVKLKEIFSNRANASDIESPMPEVTLLIAAYNEEDTVRIKMKNCSELSYPSEKLKIIWVTDGSNDQTNSILEEFENIRVLFEPERKGKTAAINRAIPFIESPIVIFTDANTLINKEAVNEIVKSFQDPVVGCVAGEKRVISGDNSNASASGEGIYWKYESALKALDSRLFTAVGAAGELFAIRRSLFTEMQPDTLLDDFVLSMKIVQMGYKISYCSRAYAMESGSLNMREEKKRKVRIAAGGIQAVYQLRSLLNFCRYPLLSFQFISHRVLRWTITPVALFILLPLNIGIVINGNHALYSILLGLQIVFYLLALTGKLMENIKIKLKVIFIPYYFLFMNINVIEGFWYLYSKKKGDGTWERAKRLN